MIPGAKGPDEVLPGNRVRKRKSKKKTLGSGFTRAEGYACTERVKRLSFALAR